MTAAVSARMSSAGMIFGRRAHEIVVVHRLPNGRGHMSEPGDDRAINLGPFPENPIGDPLREPFAIAGLESQPGFGWIGKKTALDQHCGDGGAAQDEITAPPDPAVICDRAGHNLAMDIGREGGALRAVVIGLDPVRAFTGGGIEMDADKGGVAILVGDPDSFA